jgi:arylsulfatase A-like enzyme
MKFLQSMQEFHGIYSPAGAASIRNATETAPHHPQTESHALPESPLSLAAACVWQPVRIRAERSIMLACAALYPVDRSEDAARASEEVKPLPEIRRSSSMTRHSHRVKIACFLTLVLYCGLSDRKFMACAADGARRPNIIFILADDLGWGDIGYHNSDIRTPHLDRLAASGTRLNRHYVYPTCSPTRVALLSGRFPSRFGVLAPLGPSTKMRGGDALLPHALRKLGYSAHISGKWHIGETPEHRPLRYGFDTSYGYLRGQIDPFTHRYKFGDHVTWHRNDRFVEESGHVTDLIVDEAIRVIESAGDKPFFLYVAHHSPHHPLNEPPKWIAPYETTIDDVWRRHYAAAVTHLDDGVRRIVQALERTGLRDDTLIAFSSDNGGQRSWSAPETEYNGRYSAHSTLGNNRPLRGWKGTLYEGGIRVPAFVTWPNRIPAGRVIEAPTHVVDWFPTLIRAAGGDPAEAKAAEGIDLWAVLCGQSPTLAQRIMYWKTPSASAVRQGDWKLIHFRGNRSELFHLRDDSLEKDNLAEKQPERVSQLLALLNKIAEKDIAGPDPPAHPR